MNKQLNIQKCEVKVITSSTSASSSTSAQLSNINLFKVQFKYSIFTDILILLPKLVFFIQTCISKPRSMIFYLLVLFTNLREHSSIM